MARPRTLSDEQILQAAQRLMYAHGPEALTFESLGKATGLSPATLVQRFGTKAALKRAALMLSWDGLDQATARLAAETPRTPEGAIAMLVALSRSYGDIDAYAQGLLVLREDLRDPALRARGAAWKTALSGALDARFAPAGPPDIGLVMAAQWQGSLLWWSFDPVGRVEDHVEASLKRFVSTIVPTRRRRRRVLPRVSDSGSG